MEAERKLPDEALDAGRQAGIRTAPAPIDFVRERELRTGLRQRRPADFYSLYGKRLLDIGLGVPLSIVATPIVFALAGLVIATEGRPAFYQAKRVGKDGREFRMWKLRTMVPDAEIVLNKVLAADTNLAE